MELFFISLLLVALSNAQNLDKDSSYSVSHEHRSSFSCEGRVSGYYADIESGCQLYHLCDADGRHSTHSCPNATLFQQRMMICDHWYMVDCNKSVHDYKANLLIGQRDKPFIGDDHNHHREPVNFFTIQQRAGSLQKPNWFPLVVSRPQQEPVDIDNIVPTPSPTVSSVHIGNRNLGNIGSNSPSPNPRQARYRDPNLDHRSFEHQSSTNNYQTSNSSRSVSRDVFPSVAPEKITVYPQYPQTRPQTRLPEAYSNNPFFQSLVSKSTPLPPNIPPHSNSRVQIKAEVQPSRQDKPTVKLEDIANIRFSYQETLPQPSSERRTKGFQFQSSRAQNHPSQITEHRNPNILTSNQHFQPHVPPISDATTSRHADPHVTTTKIQISEKEDNLNNIVELHLLDPRRMFYIPESKTHDEELGNLTVHISVPASPNSNSKKRSHGVMYFKNDIKTSAGQNPQCPKCHPAFLIPGRCTPCVVIR